MNFRKVDRPGPHSKVLVIWDDSCIHSSCPPAMWGDEKAPDDNGSYNPNDLSEVQRMQFSDALLQLFSFQEIAHVTGYSAAQRYFDNINAAKDCQIVIGVGHSEEILDFLRDHPTKKPTLVTACEIELDGQDQNIRLFKFTSAENSVLLNSLSTILEQKKAAVHSGQ